MDSLVSGIEHLISNSKIKKNIFILDMLRTDSSIGSDLYNISNVK